MSIVSCAVSCGLPATFTANSAWTFSRATVNSTFVYTVGTVILRPRRSSGKPGRKSGVRKCIRYGTMMPNEIERLEKALLQHAAFRLGGCSSEQPPRFVYAASEVRWGFGV